MIKLKKKSGTALLFVLFTLSLFIFAGCDFSSNTVETCVLDNTSYTEKEALESAEHPDLFDAGQAIYASVYFIESPKGMEYTGNWYLDGDKIQTGTKEMTTDKCGVIVFTLAADQVTAGTLTFEIVYGDDVLLTEDVTVQ